MERPSAKVDALTEEMRRMEREDDEDQSPEEKKVKLKKVFWVANKRFEISKFKFKFPRARTYEIIGLVLCHHLRFIHRFEDWTRGPG